MKINYDPFPHIIVDSFFNRNEIEIVNKELNFLIKSEDTLQVNLNNIYNNDIFSDIIQIINIKLFDKNFINLIKEKHEYWMGFSKNLRSITELIVLDKNNKKDKFTFSNYFFGFKIYTIVSPDDFLGGDLVFPFNHFKIKNYHNRTIIIPGWVCDEIIPIKYGKCNFIKTYVFE